MNRRTALGRLSALGFAAAAGLDSAAAQSRVGDGKRHPSIFVSSQWGAGLRTVEDVRASVRKGVAREIWQRIQTRCDAELGSEPLTARSLFAGRNEAAARQNNPDYTVCKEAGQRILRNALALLITEDTRYRETALEQMWALFDESIWPDWIDQAHLRFGLPTDLRTGMLSQDVGIGYDWLYSYLNQGQRDRIIEGLDRRGIQPYLESMKQNPWWSRDLNNWYTVIVGGLGVAGMALGDDHPESERLIDMSLERMRRYLSIYGKGGEFNESVAYSNATRIPVIYFYAYYYHSLGGSNPIAQHPFPQTGEWTVYSTLPPGRYAAFGDGWVDAPPEVEFMTAIASATRDPILQDFCSRHLKANDNPYLLLWYDPTIEMKSPEGEIPRGRAFYDNGAQFFSRSDWNPQEPTMIVYGKAKRDHNHAHNDVGQVCIDILGKRAIIDPGSPSGYPADFFDENRWKYYNASIVGHNVPMFGGREQLSPSHERGKKTLIDFEAVSGRILQSEFDDSKGGYWQLDLSNAYEGVRSVRRTVAHLLPGVAVVYDEGVLERAEEISLRWHTALPASPSSDGAFRVEVDGAELVSRVSILEGNVIDHRMLRHEYAPPFDTDRSGTLLEQRREPYVETRLRDKRYRVLTLFALSEDRSANAEWKYERGAWRIETQSGRFSARIAKNKLFVSNESILREIRVRV